MAQRVHQLLLLKHDLELVEPLRAACKPAQAALLQLFHEMLGDPRFDTMLALLATTFENTAQAETSQLNAHSAKVFAIKGGINGLLDIARRTYTEATMDIQGWLPLSPPACRGRWLHRCAGPPAQNTPRAWSRSLPTWLPSRSTTTNSAAFISS